MKDPDNQERRQVDENELMAFVDGMIEDDRRSEVLAFLASDPDEADRIEGHLRVNGDLRLLGRYIEMPENEDLYTQIEEHVGRQMVRRRRLRYGIAAGLAMVVAGGAVGSALITRDGGADMRADAPPHDTPVRERMPFSGTVVSTHQFAFFDEGEAPISWLRQQLAGHEIIQPDVASLGMRLVASGIIKSSETPAIRFVYEDAYGHHMYLYAGILNEGVEQAFALVPEGHLSLHWRRGPLAFALIAPVESPHLNEVVRVVSAAVDPEEPPQETPVTATVEAPTVELVEPSLDTGLLQTVETLEEGGAVLPVPRPNGDDADAASDPLTAIEILNAPEDL